MNMCAACGDQWKSRKPTSYDTGAKSTPIISEMQLLSHHGKKTIQLFFCDKHGNSGLRNCTKYTNGTGILKIRNVIKNSWRNASTIGVVV